MKIQSLAVIFAIIILPVIIILTYYIQRSVDTIALQTSYDTKLIDSTHDAMSSFELNTANEDLSAVADSLRSIIDASTNVFFNTLATNLGLSNANKEYIQNYIPAILYTLYDGYYIYAPTRVPTVLTTDEEQVIYVGDNGVKIAQSAEDQPTKYTFDETEYNKTETEEVKNARQTALYNSLPSKNKYEYGQMLYKNEDGTYSTEINDETEYTQDYVLKSYMPYSARYFNDDYDLTINYTLDNYLTIVGNIGNVYYSKTGYLIASETVVSVSYNGNGDLLTYNEDQAEEICLSGQYELNLKIKPFTEDGENKVSSEIELSYEPYEVDGVYLTAIEMEEKLERAYEENGDIGVIQELEVKLSNLKAITYYVRSQIFSNWVYENLGSEGLGIRVSDIAKDIADLNKEIYSSENEMDLLFDFSANNNIIFDETENPEKTDSSFYSHKLDVIRNSIQYNLNLALSSYNTMIGEMDIKMPVLSDSEWNKILTNVSIVSFMQGLNCGMKIYNNYAMVSSTNNEITVIPNEIYYTDRTQYNTSNTSDLYHRIDCPEFNSSNDLISFTSKEIKYDKIYDKNQAKYLYNHKNIGCYNCIINSNYLKNISTFGETPEVQGYTSDIIISALSPKNQKEYFRAVAKERQNLYKTNALSSSNGYEVLVSLEQDLYFGSGVTTLTIDLDNNSSLNVDKIKEIEITVRDLSSNNTSAATVTFRGIVNKKEVDTNLVLNLDQSTPQTMTIPVHFDDNNQLTSLQLIKLDPDDVVTCKSLSVKIIYE